MSENTTNGNPNQDDHPDTEPAETAPAQESGQNGQNRRDSNEKAKVSFNVNDDAEDDEEDFFTQEKRNDTTNQSAQHRSFAALNSSAQEGVQLRRDTGVPLSFVIKKLEVYIDSNELTSQLIIFIPFLLCFVFWFLADRNIEQNYYVLKGVRDRILNTEYPNVQWQLDSFKEQVLNGQRLFVELDKNYDGLGNDGDWGDWFRDVIVTTTFDCRNPDTSHVLLAPSGQNYHIGAFRFRTQRMPQYSCKVKEVLYPSNQSLFPRTCYDSMSDAELKGIWCNHTDPLTNKPMWVYRSCSEVPGAPLVALENTYHCGGFIFEIPFTATCNEAMQYYDIAVNSDCPFVDNWGTRLVVIEFFLYTPQTDTFHGVKLFTEILPGGFWIDQTMFRSFQLWTVKPINLTLDVVVILFVLYYWVRFFADLVVYYRQQGKILAFFVEFWNILELANLITFVAMFIIRFIWMGTSNSARKELQFPFQPSYPRYLDRLMYLYYAQVYSNSVNTILTFLKFLKYVRLNERLNVLTRTIAECQQSIVGVLVLFVCVILGYGITAWGLFGINMDGYRNLGVSMSTLVRILVGDMDYEAMRNENRFLAGAFFWTFVILGLFLLLNFLIAIISEAFAKVSGKAFSQDFDEIVVRWWQQTKAQLAPHNVKRQISNWIAGKSELTMLRQAVKDLKVQLTEEIEKEKQAREIRNAALRAKHSGEDVDGILDLEDTEEISVLMHRPHWRSWVSSDVYETLGEYYFDYTWEDMLNDYDDARKSSEEVDKRHMFVTVLQGVEKVVGEEIQKVDKLDQMLTQLETETTKLISALGPQG
jgi:hypothetical protein